MIIFFQIKYGLQLFYMNRGCQKLKLWAVQGSGEWHTNYGDKYRKCSGFAKHFLKFVEKIFDQVQNCLADIRY